MTFTKSRRERYAVRGDVGHPNSVDALKLHQSEYPSDINIVGW